MEIFSCFCIVKESCIWVLFGFNHRNNYIDASRISRLINGSVARVTRLGVPSGAGTTYPSESGKIKTGDELAFLLVFMLLNL